MVDESLLSVALEISQQRAELLRNMRGAILTNDLRSALQHACQLVGISEKEAELRLDLLSLPASMASELRLVPDDACTI